MQSSARLPRVEIRFYASQVRALVLHSAASPCTQQPHSHSRPSMSLTNWCAEYLRGRTSTLRALKIFFEHQSTSSAELTLQRFEDTMTQLGATLSRVDAETIFNYIDNNHDQSLQATEIELLIAQLEQDLQEEEWMEDPYTAFVCGGAFGHGSRRRPGEGRSTGASSFWPSPVSAMAQAAGAEQASDAVYTASDGSPLIYKLVNFSNSGLLQQMDTDCSKEALNELLNTIMKTASEHCDCNDTVLPWEEIVLNGRGAVGETVRDGCLSVRAILATD